MEIFHSTIISIKYGSNTHGFFSFQEPKTLLIFVHGFMGQAIPTWKDFPSMIIGDSSFAETDIIFYGYKTLDGQAADHALDLYHFLKKLQCPLLHGILPLNQNLPERSYDKIVVVAHSLGAILIRQALLIASKSNEDKNWLEKVKMALFAPAHNGANLIHLLHSSFSGLRILISLLAIFKYPIINDLDHTIANGIINLTREESKALLDAGSGEFTKAKIVVFAQGDKVVQNIPYLQDTTPIKVRNKSHTTVCKPNFEFTVPLDLVKSLI